MPIHIFLRNLWTYFNEKAPVGNDQVMAQSEKKSPLPKPRTGKKLKCHLGTYTRKTYSKPSGQLFPNRRQLSLLLITE